jgi:hypothetical protein
LAPLVAKKKGNQLYYYVVQSARVQGKPVSSTKPMPTRVVALVTDRTSPVLLSAVSAVLGFQHRHEAERFLEQLRERLGKFGLELHPEKTRLIEFGRYAAERRKKRGQGKPETFHFLGFTHMCGTSQKAGYFVVHRKTIGKRMAAKLKEIKAKCMSACTSPPRIP